MFSRQSALIYGKRSKMPHLASPPHLHPTSLFLNCNNLELQFKSFYRLFGLNERPRDYESRALPLRQGGFSSVFTHKKLLGVYKKITYPSVSPSFRPTDHRQTDHRPTYHHQRDHRRKNPYQLPPSKVSPSYSPCLQPNHRRYGQDQI